MNDSILKTLGVAFAICLVCSLIVSSAAVSLRDLQKENKLNDRRIKVLKVADIYKPDQSISEQFKQLESKFVDFNTGKVFDEYQNLKDLSNEIAKTSGVVEYGIFQDIANVALIAENNQIETITLES